MPKSVPCRLRAAPVPAAAEVLPLKRPDAVPARGAGSLSPQDWIQAATDVLVDEGIGQVRVDVLARRLGVTRGSFYWHFKDRDALLRAVLASWRDQATEQLTARLERAHTEAAEQLADVLTLPFRGRAAARAARIELAIRAWARRDDTARAAVDEADASRIGYIAQIFSALGLPLREARMRAFVVYSYVVAESMMANQGSSTHRAERRHYVEELVRLPGLPRG